ncbi:MAG TPA: hypothetical protein VFL13_04110 [Candidatus Baltobacteraceae bacterium]|nr:hypothetical protein [Candidatus Baltobacteraceae bacterium]
MVGATFKKIASASAALCAALTLAACAGNGGGGGAQANVDATTKAVYNDDSAGTTQYFDDALRNQFSRSELGIMSDQMHRLGDYHGLTFVGSDASKNEYTYRAGFDKGAMNVTVRMDPDGKFSAYRVFPQ